MLQNIVFQDNLYQLARSIENAREGLLLDLSPEYFYKKIVDDIFFFDSCIQQIHGAIQKSSKLPDYLSLMKTVYSCQEKYIALLKMILERKTPIAASFDGDMDVLDELKERHLALKEETKESITKSEKAGDSRDIVSTSELSELLSFR